MGLNTSLSFATLSDGFTINKKVFPTHPLGAFQGEPGRAYILSQPYFHPNFLKEEEMETWEVSKPLKVSELVNAFNSESVARTLDGGGLVGGEGGFSLCLVQMPKNSTGNTDQM